MEDEEFWNKSSIQSFSFDEDDRVSEIFKITSESGQYIFSFVDRLL